jgi:prepilin-type N-terminal cleavage/methylation domain-containing protein/prepilin-type processing-associated H-X9-DG protein
MRIPSSTQRSQGFTLIELLVVISIIAILAGMLLPVIGVVREMARQQECGKKQSQILGSMVAYGTAEDVAWPNPMTWKVTAAPTDGATAAAYTAGAFELLAKATTLPNKLFRCPSAASGGPDKEKVPSMDRTDTTWGWGTTENQKVSYGFDWGSPADPSASRVILGDRDLQNHKDGAMVCFGDGHVKKLKKESTRVASTGTNKTEGVIAVQEEAVFNPDAKGGVNNTDLETGATLIRDNIYDTNEDYVTPANVFKTGAGHAIRAWIR